MTTQGLAGCDRFGNEHAERREEEEEGKVWDALAEAGGSQLAEDGTCIFASEERG